MHILPVRTHREHPAYRILLAYGCPAYRTVYIGTHKTFHLRELCEFLTSRVLATSAGRFLRIQHMARFTAGWGKPPTPATHQLPRPQASGGDQPALQPLLPGGSNPAFPLAIIGQMELGRAGKEGCERNWEGGGPGVGAAELPAGTLCTVKLVANKNFRILDRW
jgi:hypothetical protein